MFGNDANPYDSYGLDFLKDAICKLNGVDPITMQLFTSQDELTTATPLHLLETKVIFLMIKSPITLTFKNPTTTVWRGESYALDQNIDFLKGTVAHTAPTICYIHTPDYNTAETVSSTPPPPTTIEAIGLNRDFFKISTTNLPFHLLRDTSWTYADPFIFPAIPPDHIWMRFDRRFMTIAGSDWYCMNGTIVDRNNY